LANFKTFFLLALEATAFLLRGIMLMFFDVGGSSYAALNTKCRVKRTCSVLPGLSGWDEQLSPD
jgi:hypothetical protein